MKKFDFLFKGKKKHTQHSDSVENFEKHSKIKESENTDSPKAISEVQKNQVDTKEEFIQKESDESLRIESIEQFIKYDPEYDQPKFPFYTHKSSRGNSTGLLWICKDCGFTSNFSYRNDMICASGIYYCKDCGVTQNLTPYYNGYKMIKCLICNKPDSLEPWDGKICPKCNGKIVQYNGIKWNSRYTHFHYNNIHKDITFEKVVKSIQEKDIANRNATQIDGQIKGYLKDTYGINDPDNCTEQEAMKVTKIVAKIHCEHLNNLAKFKNLLEIDVEDSKVRDVNLKGLVNLKKLNCNLCPLESINLSENTALEELSFYGTRTPKITQIDLSSNTKLRKLTAGQTSIIRLDLSRNPLLEELDMMIMSSLLDLNLSKCTNLKSLNLMCNLIPTLDIRQNHNLSFVRYTHCKIYNAEPWHKRPILYVNKDFDKNVIDSMCTDLILETVADE